MEPLTNKPTDQELIEKCESHINALRYEGYNWKELAELLTRFKSPTENRSELVEKCVDAVRSITHNFGKPECDISESELRTALTKLLEK